MTELPGVPTEPGYYLRVNPKGECEPVEMVIANGHTHVLTLGQEIAEGPWQGSMYPGREEPTDWAEFRWFTLPIPDGSRPALYNGIAYSNPRST